MTAVIAPIECVVFDFGGTLSPPRPADEDRAVDPAATEAVRLLHDRGLSLVLASNTRRGKPSRYIHLAEAGIIDCFGYILLSEEIGIGKPHPYFYARALAVAARPPERVLWVGNRMDKDVTIPLTFGIRAVLVDPDGREGAPPAGVPVLRHVAELPALLDAWATQTGNGAER